MIYEINKHGFFNFLSLGDFLPPPKGVPVRPRLLPLLHRPLRRLLLRDGQHVRPPDQRQHPEARGGVQQHPRGEAQRAGEERNGDNGEKCSSSSNSNSSKDNSSRRNRSKNTNISNYNSNSSSNKIAAAAVETAAAAAGHRSKGHGNSASNNF